MPRHVFVITVEHLAPDLIGAYGRFDAQTPTLDELAARAFVFHNAIGGERPARNPTAQQTCWQRCESAGVAVQTLTPPWNPPPREWTHTATETIRETLGASQPQLLWLPLQGIADTWIPVHPGWEDEVARRLGTPWHELLADEPDMTPERAVQELAAEGHFSRRTCPDDAPKEVDQLSLALYQACVDRLDERLGRFIREYQRHAHADSLLIVAGRAGDLLPRVWPIERPIARTADTLRVPLFVEAGIEESVGTAVLELVEADDLWTTAELWLTGKYAGMADDSLDLLQVATKAHPGRSVVRRRGPCGEQLIRTPTAQLVTRPAAADDPEAPPVAWLTLKPEDEWDLLNVSGQNPDLVQQLESLGSAE